MFLCQKGEVKYEKLYRPLTHSLISLVSTSRSSIQDHQKSDLTKSVLSIYYDLESNSYLFMLYLTTLSAAQLIQPQMVGSLINGESERMCKKAVVSYFKLLQLAYRDLK